MTLRLWPPANGQDLHPGPAPVTSLGWVGALQLHGDSPPLTRLALGLGDWSRMSWKQDAGKKTKREIKAA